jgi:mono/diheme cytochrome c family protein
MAVTGCCAAILLAVACGQNTDALTGANERQAQDDQAALKGGESLYTANCQSCHGGREGKGGADIAPPHNETGHTWHHPDAQLKEWILNGKTGQGRMPPFKDKLSEEEVNAILAYIKTWWTEEQRQSHADVSRRHQEALDRQKRGQ